MTTSNITEPFTVRVSFPDGAPPLNKTSLLKVTVKSNYPSLKGMKIIVNLPESLELVTGELTWLGDVPAHSRGRCN